MAANAIGKISFQVVADTSRVDRNLGESAKSFQRYATAINRTISGASAGAAKQFNAILTPLQRLNEALNQGTGRLQFRGLEQSRQQIEQLALASREVAKPLADVAKSFDSLSLGVQGAFIPSLVAAQDQVRNLESAITSGKGAAEIEKQFARASLAVQKTAAAVSRLNEVQRLSGSLATGRELQFTDPSFAQRLNAAAAASSRAVSSPASLISANPQIAALTTQLGNAVEEAAQLQAKLEDARLTGLRQDITAAEAKLSSAEQTVERLTNRLNSATAAPGIAAASGRLNILSQQDLQDDARLAASREIGADISPAVRQLDQLAQRVQGVRGQIDSLPATIGTGFIPQLQRAEQEFIRLRASGRATAEEIENASNSVEQLAAQVRRVGAAQGLGSFADGLSDTALRGAIGSLQALQQILNRVGATAGSEAAAQFDRMRAAIQRATREGTIGSEAFQRELRQISQEAANAAAATGRIGRAAAFREIQRGGDIARGGFDKLSLATQQAAFAIDDFFSATGDFTQKIRAVQNNVTQLAFILGGTTGLFIGLGVAIAAQAAVALFKWSQGTVDAEDKTQALNDALARQKGLVEELKQAFDSLGDSLTRGIFDEATERARKFEQQLKSIEEAAAKQVEFAAAVSPEVQAERARQADLQKQLEESSDGGQRAALQSQIDLSKQAESKAIERERQLALAVDFDQVSQALADGVRRITRGRAGDLFQPSDEARANVFRVGDVESALLAEGLSDARDELGDDLLAAERVLLDRYNALTETFNELPDTSGLLGFGRATLGLLQGAEDNNNPRFERAAVEDERNKLGRLLEQVRFKIADQNSKLISDAARTANDVAGTLRESLSVVVSDLGGSGPLAQQRTAIAEQLAALNSELTGAVGEDGRLGTTDDTLNRSEIEERQRLLVSLQQQADANLSAVRSAKTFSEVLARVAGELSETVAGEAQSAASQARRDLNKAIGEQQALPAGASPDQQLAARRGVQQALEGDAEASAQARSIAARRRQIEADQRIAEQEFQRQAAGGQLGQGLQQSIRERDRLQTLVASGQGGPEAASRLEQVIADIADAFEQTDLAQRLRDQADALDQEQQRFVATRNRRQQQEEQLQQSVQRGQDLLRTPEQRAAEEGVRSFNDAINASIDGLAGQLEQLAPNIAALEDGRLTLSELSGVFAQFPALREQFIQDLQVARDNISGNISEQIAQFDAERARPSRAALQAQDVNTQQGRAELNRLLRGDDANRDQPVLQGIKEQTAVLKVIDSRIDQVRQAVGLAGI